MQFLDLPPGKYQNALPNLKSLAAINWPVDLFEIVDWTLAQRLEFLDFKLSENCLIESVYLAEKFTRLI